MAYHRDEDELYHHIKAIVTETLLLQFCEDNGVLIRDYKEDIKEIAIITANRACNPHLVDAGLNTGRYRARLSITPEELGLLLNVGWSATYDGADFTPAAVKRSSERQARYARAKEELASLAPATPICL